MATSSTVAKLNDDGTVTQISIHWDGYTEGVGTELLNKYTTPESVDRLLAEGDHNELFDIPVSYRSRGQTHRDARVYANRTVYERQGLTERFNYLFDNGVWLVSTSGLVGFDRFSVTPGGPYANLQHFQHV